MDPTTTAGCGYNGDADRAAYPGTLCRKGHLVRAPGTPWDFGGSPCPSCNLDAWILHVCTEAQDDPHEEPCDAITHALLHPGILHLHGLDALRRAAAQGWLVVDRYGPEREPPFAAPAGFLIAWPWPIHEDTLHRLSGHTRMAIARFTASCQHPDGFVRNAQNLALRAKKVNGR